MNLKKTVVVFSSRVPKKTTFIPRKVSSFVPKKIVKRARAVAATAQMVPLADIHLYSLTSTDLFTFYATRAFLTTHAPLLFMYRGILRLPWTYSAYFLLFVSVFKSLLEI